MKITIQSNHKKEIIAEDVVLRINELTSSGFATLIDNKIMLQSCSNAKINNRMAVLLIIFFDQNWRNDSYSNIGYNNGVTLRLPTRSKRTFLIELKNMLDQINNLQDVEIAIEE